MGSWAFNATGFTYWSSDLFRVYGLEPSSKPPTVEEYLARVHPEDRAFMKQGVAKMLDDHLAFDFTKRIVRPSGEIRHVRCVGVPVTQGDIFQGFLGTGMDVTEQRLLTEELQRQQPHLASNRQTLSSLGEVYKDAQSISPPMQTAKFLNRLHRGAVQNFKASSLGLSRFWDWGFGAHTANCPIKAICLAGQVFVFTKPTK
jgi:PAS domain-containing protein